MINHQDQLSLEGLPVFTQLQLETPLQEALSLPSDACYLHIDEGEGHRNYYVDCMEMAPTGD